MTIVIMRAREPEDLPAAPGSRPERAYVARRPGTPG